MTTHDALLTDRYEIAMLLGYLRSGIASRRAVCELFVRRLPANRPFLVTAGLERIVRKLLALRFTEEEIAHLGAQPALAGAMTPDARRYLRDFRFRGELWAMPEGTVAFAGEPLLRVEAALPEAQLVETLLLSIVNHDARVATKAARIAL
ncbi:MAG TPA: nicotinate phosphoribosyltransferase, partial [Planctomycetota bacterium]|nr:nicotinate phosphoribosyltransferase [Planctomycetota bacterium]